MRNYIEAKDGMVLTNGEIYGTKIYLADGIEANSFYEITKEEYNSIINVDPENMATVQDYQEALRNMGVGV